MTVLSKMIIGLRGIITVEASQSNLTFTAGLPQAVAGADLVQENGPEQGEALWQMYATI